MVSEISCCKQPYHCAGCGASLKRLSGYCQACLDKRNRQFVEDFHQGLNKRVGFYYTAFHCYKPCYWRLNYRVYRKSAREM